jgi:hypothetical protein
MDAMKLINNKHFGMYLVRVLRILMKDCDLLLERDRSIWPDDSK